MNQEIELKLNGFPELFIGEMPSKSKPIIVENPSPDGIEVVKITDIYCDLVAGKEYEFSAEANLPFAKSLDDGVEYYLYKDKSSKTRIGITHLGRTDRTDSIPEMYFDRIVNGNRVTARFTPAVSGRYYLRFDNNQDNSVAEFYNATIKQVYDIPVTDTAERNAQLQGEDCVKLVWSDARCVNLPALSYIEYDNERFYLQNTYIPTKKGDVYSYNVKFVKIHNLFSDAMFLRNVNVDGVIWQEPQFDINANKKIMTDMVVESINNLPFVKSLGISFKTPYNSILQDDYYNEYVSTKLESFSFDCSKVAEVLNNIADTFETEWWVEDTEDISVKILHIDKCQTKDITLELSDNYIEESDHTYTSMGLTSVEPDNNNNIPERLYVYGSDRNITKKTVQQQVEGGVMNVSYAKRLRLNNEVAPYETKTKSGVDVIVNTNESSISIKNISNGKMDSYTNEEIYPKMNMVVSEVREERNSEDMPLFYLKSDNLTSDFMDSEIAESYPDSLNPSRQGLLIEGTTLMVTFTSGLLNGMEFECAWYQSRAEIGIIPEESDDQQIPYGSIRPKAGDTFVLWNLMMPQSKIREAQAELLEDALNYIDENVETITGCKCKSDALYFAEHNLTPSIKLGRRIKIDSEVFANTIFNASSLTSRVKSYSYKLTKPYDVTFNLSEARSEGVLSSFENEITNIKIDAKQNTELARSISRRQWHDIEEMSSMIESIKTQMLVVGNEHGNFAMTSSIGYDNKTRTLSVSLGVLTHASYVEYGQNGAWRVTAFEKKFTDNEANIPYYIYARCSKSNITATIYTSESEINDDSTYFYFLIGILSSEYENARVFNKTSGLSTIIGGTITTEQIQDYNRSLIIDFSSNPPRIIARNGAIIEGAIKFTSFKDNAGNEVLNDISNVANNAINKAESADAKAIQASTTANNANTNADDAKNTANTANNTATTAKSTAEKANTNAQNAQNIANKAQVDVDALGTSVKPITDAIKGSTEIKGGLVTTNVLMVKDSDNAISGGMSGVSSDNIAFWSGGSLADAINGNCNVIIRKDGTAKIGAFLIENGIAKIQLDNGSYATMSPNGIEVSLDNQGKAKFDTTGVSIIDSSNIEKIKLIDGEIDFEKFRKTKEQSITKITDVVFGGDNFNINASNSTQILKDNSTGKDIVYTIDTIKNNLTINANLDIRLTRYYKTNTNSATNNYNIIIYSGNIALKKIALRVVLNSNTQTYYYVYNAQITSSNINSIFNGATASTTGKNSSCMIKCEFNETLVGSVGEHNLSIVVSPISSGYASGKMVMQIYSTATGGEYAFKTKVEEYTPRILIGTNGMMNFQTSYKFFGAWLDNEDKYHIEAKGDINLNGKEI